MPPTRKKTTNRPKAPTAFVPPQLSSDTPVEEERETLFVIDDVEYTIPLKVPKSLSLRVMRTARLHGELAASQELMEAVMGEDGFLALMNCPGVTDDQFDAISDHLMKRVMGEAEGKA
ncbi:hypothetical protein [Streptomyces sp. MMBL 11-1]|uniref:hypothetical protein n=1 Tax=Streptomyces sp. MMBL 11-1 TaxID=3026420 RepID=UPI002361C7BC|nr:hypothetical protein [Streptomyces sp. MMBL 11-1]